MAETVRRYRQELPNQPSCSLAVEFTRAPRDHAPSVMFCGGFHSTMFGNKGNWLQGFCKLRGWAFTRFDYRGHGESDGDAAYCTLEHWLDDTLSVLGKTDGPQLLIGSSMGAWLAVWSAIRQPDKVNALLTIAAAPDFTQELLWPALTEQQRQDISGGKIIQRPTAYANESWPISRALIESGKALSLLSTDRAASVHCPVRMLHGTADVDVPWTHSQRLLDNLGSDDVRLILLKNGDHRLSDARSLKILSHMLDELLE